MAVIACVQKHAAGKIVGKLKNKIVLDYDF